MTLRNWGTRVGIYHGGEYYGEVLLMALAHSGPKARAAVIDRIDCFTNEVKDNSNPVGVTTIKLDSDEQQTLYQLLTAGFQFQNPKSVLYDDLKTLLSDAWFFPMSGVSLVFNLDDVSDDEEEEEEEEDAREEEANEK